MDIMFIIKWLCAFSPIAVVLILMIGFKWGGGRAGAADDRDAGAGDGVAVSSG